MILVKDLFEDIVQSISTVNHPIYFFYGYWPEIVQDIMAKGRSRTLEKQCYPAIMLNANFSRKKNEYDRTQINPTFHIIAQTDANYSANDRIENIYKPIIYPIYDKFLKQIHDSRKFFVSSVIEREEQDLYYLRGGDKSQNKINDYVDALEVKFPNLQLLNKNL